MIIAVGGVGYKLIEDLPWLKAAPSMPHRWQGCIREKTGANVLGLKRGDNMIVSPTPSTKLNSGNVLVALGTR